ncbi:transcription initiation factor TFIID subunit 4-like [Alligator mississippiensis]|uniref:transcription initiation factor TFIID subunit 4-like n=1 Tax=Alligator mississippiensis TaxID=8496 RepID=UPI002877884B|nr:transcription initiation factor TFIID subunit 4-like [Alligator mississippiensis]
MAPPCAGCGELVSSQPHRPGPGEPGPLVPRQIRAGCGSVAAASRLARAESSVAGAAASPERPQPPAQRRARHGRGPAPPPAPAGAAAGRGARPGRAGPGREGPGRARAAPSSRQGVLDTLQVYEQLPQPTIHCSARSCVNGPCTITLNCTVPNGGNDMTYSWSTAEPHNMTAQ